jgi:hypothetical protein
MRDRIERLLASRKGLVLLYALFLGSYLGASGERLRQHSAYNHFAYLADCWLHGRLALAGPPPNENDWALVDVLKLRDGRVVKGSFSKTNLDRFYPLSGPSLTILPDQIESRSNIRYVSFPPAPAVFMLPLVAIWGVQLNDVLFGVIWGAFNPVLLFLLLRDLVRRGYSKRTAIDDLWLTAVFGVGSVYFYAACVGQVWYTAHVVGVTFAIGYAWASVEASRPLLAGLCLGLGYATRTPMAFMFPFFLWEALRMAGGWKAVRERRRLPPGLLSKLLRFAAPAAAVVILLFIHNFARFQRFTEFGHTYLNIGWAERIQRWGLFNYHFLSRNLACALVLMPRILAQYPWVKVGQHGMSLLITSPNLAYTVAPRERSPLGPGLWLTIAAMALPGLLYQNSGQYQFGYRFSIDYLCFLVMLLAIGNRRLSWFFKTLVVLAAGVNLFGAITFDRFMQFTYDDSFFPHGNN